MCTLLTMIKYQSLSRKVQGYMSQTKQQSTFQGNICLPDGQLCFYIYMDYYYKVGHCLFSSGYTGHWGGTPGCYRVLMVAPQSSYIELILFLELTYS